MIAAVLRELMAAGVTGEDLIAAVERIEKSADSPPTKADAAAEKRRAYDRERMARKRGHPPTSADSPPMSECALSSSLLTTSEIQKESKKEKARAKLCPVDFLPSESHFAIGVERGMTATQVRASATEMIEWSHANSGRAVAKKSDWNLAFNSWLRRNNNNGQGRPRAFQNDELSVSRAADRLQERIERDGITAFPPRPTLLPREGQGDLQLLPPGRGTGS